MATSGHQDFGDKYFCSVFTFQQCIGGQLCLYKPGIVLESRAGVVIFQSAKITHFNMHFEGIHGSLVLHSDKSGDKWTEGYNNWDASVY